jgi:MFS family permease
MTKTLDDRSGVVVIVLAIAGIVGSLMQTLVVPLIGQLPVLLHTSAANASWAITITLLVGALATPSAGRLGDLYGKKPMMLIGLVPQAVGSIVCATAHSLAPMIIGRGLQGLGFGLIPLAISALRDILPPQRLGSAIALISSSLGIGGALGLPLSATVAEHTNWHVLFWFAAGLTVVSWLLILFLVPATPAIAHSRFDVVGALGLGGVLVCLLLAISKGADWGWTSGTVLGLAAVGLVGAPIWGWWELRVTDPLIDLRVTARRQVLVTNAASVVVGFAMYAQMLVVPQLLELPGATGYGLGQSLQAAGLWLAPMGLMMMIISPYGARLSAARGARTTLFAGALIIALGYGASLLLMGSAPGVMVGGCIISAGTAFAYGAMPALIMAAVPQAETAAANAFNTLMRSIGTSTCAAVIGVVLSHLTANFGGHLLPSEHGFRVALVIGGGVALVAAAVVLALPRTAPAVADTPAAELTDAVPEPVEVRN